MLQKIEQVVLVDIVNIVKPPPVKVIKEHRRFEGTLSKKNQVAKRAGKGGGQNLRKGGLHTIWGEEPSTNYVLKYLT